MAESTLTQTYFSLRNEIARYLRYGRSYHEGTITSSTATVTVAGSRNPIPDDITTMKFRAAGNASSYAVATRINDTQFTITSPPASITAATNYEVAPWTSTQAGDIDDVLQQGYMQFLHPLDPSSGKLYQWKFLRPINSIIVWPDQAAASTSTIDFGSYSDPTTEVTQASGSAGVFYESMVGKTLTVTASGNTYTIASYTNANTITVTGDASAETDDGQYSIDANGDYQLPDNFGGIDGLMYYDDTNSLRPDVVPRNPMQIIQYRQGISVSTQTPQFYAVKPRTFDATVGQRYDLMLYPEPDTVYTLNYRGQGNPDLPTALNLYGLGGMPHGNTLLESMLSVAESMLDDTEGLHMNRYQRFLMASISYDKKSHGPESVGFNYDNSSRKRHYDHEKSSLVKYNGVLYEG